MSNSNDSEINNNLEPEKNQENDPKLSRRDALKRAAKQTLGLAGLFAALPALSSIAKAGNSQTPEGVGVPEGNSEGNYYSYPVLCAT